MRQSLLLAATLMMVTTATSWAQSTTEGTPNIKQPDQENVSTQMRDTWESFKHFSVEQKNEALAVARRALENLDQEIDETQKEIDKGWQNLSQEARLEKQETLSELKDERKELQAEYQELEAASADNWEEAKRRFGSAWQSTKQAWRDLTAPSPDADTQ